MSAGRRCSRGAEDLSQVRRENAKKLFPTPRVYEFHPPMHARMQCTHSRGCQWRVKTMSDRLGNNFVGIAPPEYIRDVLCAQASDPTRPPREPRSARRFWGRSGCCSRRNCEMKSFAGTQALVRVMHREQCWRVQRSGWCLRRSTHGATALFTGNGPDSGCDRR